VRWKGAVSSRRTLTSHRIDLSHFVSAGGMRMWGLDSVANGPYPVAYAGAECKNDTKCGVEKVNVFKSYLGIPQNWSFSLRICSGTGTSEGIVSPKASFRANFQMRSEKSEPIFGWKGAVSLRRTLSSHWIGLSHFASTEVQGVGADDAVDLWDCVRMRLQRLSPL
ncbi:hypothetical protein SARC_02044, partial [Sphaeroforma arctica JP610]